MYMLWAETLDCHLLRRVKTPHIVYCGESLLFQTEGFRISESIHPSRVDQINVIKMYIYQCCLSIVHVMITCSSICKCEDSAIPSQAPKSGTAQPNSDHGKSMKVSINSPVYRRERHSQSTDMGMRWTNSHQPTICQKLKYVVSSNINAKK